MIEDMVDEVMDTAEAPEEIFENQTVEEFADIDDLLGRDEELFIVLVWMNIDT